MIWRGLHGVGESVQLITYLPQDLSLTPRNLQVQQRVSIGTGWCVTKPILGSSHHREGIHYRPNTSPIKVGVTFRNIGEELLTDVT